MTRIKVILLFLTVSVCTYSQNWDVEALRNIHTPKALPSDELFRAVSISDGLVCVITPASMLCMGAIKGNEGLRWSSYTIIASALVTVGLTEAIKYSVHRTRPYDEYPQYFINKSGSELYDPSFPSGHTSSAFSLATTLSLSYPKWYVIAPSFIYAGSVGYSRMYLGVHYPSDVLIGAFIGSLTAYITFKVTKEIRKQY